MHIYETADWWNGKGFSNWFENNYQETYFSIMKKYKDKISLEVTGHNHLAGMRIQSLGDSDDSDEYYLSKVIFPGLTAASATQPGFASFVYDTDSATIEELEFTYVDVNGSIGKPEDTPFDELTWLKVDFTEKFDLPIIDGDSIADFIDRLTED